MVFYESFYQIEIISQLILQSLWAIPGHWKSATFRRAFQDKGCNDQMSI